MRTIGLITGEREPPWPERPHSAGDGVEGVHQASSDLVGRQKELAVIDAALGQARDGRGSAVIVTGAAGIGKSRLVTEAIHELTELDDVVLQAACTPDPGAPDHWPWLQVTRQCGLKFPQAVLGDDLFRFYDGTVSRIRSLARQHLVIVAIEDAHWADVGSLRLLELLCRSTVDAAVLVVVTHRDCDPSLGRACEAGLARVAKYGPRLTLGGLPEAATASLMVARSGQTPTPTLQHEVHTLTGGNPMLIDHVVRHLAAGISLSDLDTLPDQMTSPAAQLLDRLPAGDLAALEAAAVIGREADEALLADVLAEPEPAVRTRLQELHQRQPGLIEPGDVAGTWRFNDPLVCETLLSRPDAERLGQLHRRTGEALIREGEPQPPRVARAATHLLVAAQTGPVERAVELCRLAASQAAHTSAHGEAVTWLQDAVDLAYRDPTATDPQRLELLLLLADAQVDAGQASAGHVTFAKARRLADRCGDVAGVARAVLGGVNAHRRELGWDASLTDLSPLLERTTDVLAPHAETHPELLARLLAARTMVGALLSDPATARECARQAHAVGAPSDHAEARHASLVAARWAAVGPTPLADKRRLTEQLLLDAVTTDDPVETWLALRWQLHDGLEAGDPDVTAGAVTRSLNLAEDLGQPDLLAHSHLHAATLALIEGRADDVRRLHQRARQALPGRPPKDTLLAQELYLSWELGHVDLTLLRAAMELVPSALRAALGCWASMIGNDDAARSKVKQFFAELTLDDIPEGAHWSLTLCMMAEAVARTGMTEHADELRGQLLPLADRCGVDGPTPRVWIGSHHLYLGMLAVTLDDLAAAERHLSAARHLHRRMGARCHLIRGEIWQARLTVQRGDPTAARPLLESTARHAELLGMVAAAADARLALDGLKTPASAPACWELRRDGDSWHLSTGTNEVRLRDRKGLAYLHLLLGRPNQEVHVLELIGAQASSSSQGTGPMLDAEAKAAYQRRVEDLRDQIDEGERWADAERAARAQEELDAIARELASSMGLGGRDRPSDTGERARVSVRKAIRSAIDVIAGDAPEIAAHLDATVRTGYYCVHVPDPTARVTWRT